MSIKKIIRLYNRGSVCVTGERGSGKDMLQANVIFRRKKPYVSNINYRCQDSFYQDFDYENINLSGNTYKDILNCDVDYYEYPYIMGSDIYISDIGVYFPSQYCNELNKAYPSLPLFFALSRQLGRCNVHLNVQNLGRAWDKIREQSDTYIRCRYCHVFFGLVFQGITLYDKAQSCQDRVKPFKMSKPLINRESKTMISLYRDSFFNTHGMVKNMFLVYRNKSDYDTYYFEKLFKGEVLDVVYLTDTDTFGSLYACCYPYSGQKICKYFERRFK